MQVSKKISFPKEASSGFYQELKQRVSPLLQNCSLKMRLVKNLKVILFPSLYVLAYIVLLSGGLKLPAFYLSYVFLGLLLPLTVLNLVHDALHRCLFKNPTYNKLAAYLLDAMGGNSYVWHKRHVQFHHSYTNIPDWDVDLSKKKIFRLAPNDTLRKAHRYQHFYMPFIYLLFTFHWVLVRDFQDFFNRHSEVRRHKKVPLFRYAELVAFKLFYGVYILVIPIVVLGHGWYHYLFGFLLLHAVSSLLTLLIILPTHWDEDAVFYIADETLKMPETWALHQLKTTNDYTTYQPLVIFSWAA